ncbi:BZ3500_MvSof-1268-A1-R1_Chr2-3g05311 [Microbotryum saponariae]|uniref:BZ3500_MvSof-1268-A1-R1_Chr2-3g05311 protein n=1 Tax=Microbotryum saponariae TaxID=289078 RepID=A0A2X0L3N6_9BASI|nr:BZ3500_MvSof-1268-A1-R1_Chr2-3g05311 [Microbotryum saponariae]SDA01174.1 BZ3501_MvSof-1269-A2-R1_Chr2-2g04984 [Microbotryum saponariae]
MRAYSETRLPADSLQSESEEPGGANWAQLGAIETRDTRAKCVPFSQPPRGRPVSPLSTWTNTPCSPLPPITMAERRKQEILDKKAKLAELKRAREERIQLSSTSSSRASASPASTRPSSVALHERVHRSEEIDAILKNAGVVGPSLSSGFGTKSAEASPKRGTAGSSVGAGEDSSSTPAPSSPGGPSIASAPSDPTPTIEANEAAAPVAAPQPVAAPTTSAPPVVVAPPKVLYDKSIQTSQSTPLTRAAWTTTSTSTDPTRSPDPSSSSHDPVDTSAAGRENADELRARILRELEEERLSLEAQIAQEKRLAEQELRALRSKGLAPPELANVLGSGGFLEFLDSSTKIVQRALSDSYDYLMDYSVNASQEGEEGDGAKVRLLGGWTDDKVVRGRSITAVDWSPKFPELFVASYNKTSLTVNEPDGIVCVWNLHLRERPEYVFHAQSDVLSVCFSPFHPNLIIGGTYSGQILLWDTRSKHPYAVFKTPLSAAGHTHPVYSLSIVGTQHAHNLISASTDGTVCAWTLDLLARPHETLTLTHPSHTKTEEVSITALAFPSADAASFCVGTEEGNIYTAQRYDRAGSKAGLVMTEVYKGHSGPVTSLEFHPPTGSVDLSDLFLSSGVDWTVKLWRLTNPNATTSSTSTSHKTNPSSTSTTSSNTNSNLIAKQPTGSTLIRPLFSFEDSTDYLFDVKWHPHHPSIFATVDGSGKFDLWNLNIDAEVPLVSTVVGEKGLNRLCWDKEGKKVALGGAEGKVWVYEVHQGRSGSRGETFSKGNQGRS